MRGKALGLFVVALFIFGLLAPVQIVGAERVVEKLEPSLIDRLDGASGGGLRIQGDSVFVFVSLNPGYHASDLESHIATRFIVGRPDSPIAVYGSVSMASLLSLASLPAVSHVFPDVKLVFDQMKPDPEVYSEHLATDMYRIRQIIGADRVNQLGINGTGVTIAIADTGTDFTIPDLQGAVARNSMGQAITFDADGQSLVLTNLTVTRFGNLLATAGKVVSVWNAASYVTYTNPSQSQIEKVTLHYNYVAPSVFSKSGYYHFGILREEFTDVVSASTVDLNFPVVVVDANKAGVYDTVFVDMPTAYYNFLVSYRDSLNQQANPTPNLNLSLTWPSPQPSWDDHSFANAQPHMASPGKDLIYFDPNNTGVPVFSAGLLAYGVDLSGYTGKNFALLPPIDPNGNFINVYFDSESHGTSTASSAASRGVLKRDIYHNGTLLSLPGIAPGASLMGVKVLWVGDITFGWYYAAGFDWNPADFSFQYTGQHRADIISNSWGDPDPIQDLGSTFGFDYESQLADALSLPHYLDPAYPGVVMLFSGGNGGFGYGTINSPAASTLAVTVGASTNFAYLAHPAIHLPGEVGGSYDDVAYFSARGPTSIGEPKPDVVNVGLYGFTDQTTFTGYGNGTSAYTLFGGTSLSAPLTAGVVALVIQEYRSTHSSISPDPGLVKTILASSANDLSYDQFTQGSGRVNALGAVAAAAEGNDARFPSRFYVYSTATWDTVRGLLAKSWASNFQTPIPPMSSISTDWYAGMVSPGQSASAVFEIKGATGQPSAQAFHYTLISRSSYQYVTTSNFTWVELPESSIPTDTALMKVTVVYNFSEFVNASSWQARNILTGALFDTRFDIANHTRLINISSPSGTASEVDLSNPLSKFQGVPYVRIRKIGPTQEIPFELIFRYYRRSSWDWMTQLSISGNALTARLTVPNGTLPGVYGGFIGVSDNGSEVLVPVTVAVPIASAGTYTADSENTPYTNFEVYGAFDWDWHYDAGDWRTFAIIVPPNVGKVSVHLSWSDSQTLIQEHLVNPQGFLVASSEYPTSAYSGSAGIFYWSTSTGGPAQDISVSNPPPGIYFLVLHTVLFGGNSTSYPEDYTLSVEMS